MPSLAATSPSSSRLRSALDNSYQQLSSVKSLNESIDVGSAVSADSFTYLMSSRDDESDEFSYDPYLDSARRRMKYNRSKKADLKAELEFPRTPATLPLNDSIEEEEKQSSSPGSFKGLVLEIPVKSFAAPCAAVEFVPETRACADPRKSKAIHERNFWNRIVSERVKAYGTIHPQVAEGLLLLGNAHMNAKEYSQALSVYQGGVRIFREIYGRSSRSHLSVARLLDKVGLAACRLHHTTHDNVAYGALNEAFTIRYEFLGPHHVDTVDTLNNIAAVELHQLKDYNAAYTSYKEVFIVRQIIFGAFHPSVAITAQALGSLSLRLKQLDDAATYYRKAMQIYISIKLKPSNPTMQRLLRDIAQLERVSSGVKRQQYI